MAVKIAVIIGLCLLFWLICFLNTGNDKKNMLGFRSYPKEVQEIVKNYSTLGKIAPKKVSLVRVFMSNLILFTIIFVVVGFALKYTVGFDDFKDAFIYFLILGETLNLFDLVVIDLIWWRNNPRIRFSCATDKKLYQNPSVHVESFIRAIFMYLIIAILVSLILNL